MSLKPIHRLMSPRTPRRADRQNAVSRACCEILEGRRLLSFNPAVSYAAGTNAQDVVTADFNNDDQLDLAVAGATYSGSTVSVLLGNADGSFQPAVTSTFAVGANSLSIAVGDFNDDGTMDLAAANGGTNGVSVMIGNGDGTFGALNFIDIGSDPASVAVGDFNGDGKLDLGVTSNFSVYDGYDFVFNPIYHNEGNANVLLGIGGGSFSAPNVTSLGYGNHTSAAAADFNGDGKHDFATLNTDYGTVNVLLGNATGLGAPTSFNTGFYPQAVTVGDFTGDGILDLATAGQTVDILPGLGDGTFQGVFRQYVDPAALAAADFNGDGKLDVVTANYGDTVSVLLGTGDGVLGPPIDVATGAMVAAGVAVGDFNGDGWLDVATANGGGNTVSVLINDQAWPPAPASLSIDNVTVTEGDSGAVAAVFTVTRGGSLAGSATVNYSTANGGALAGSDYVAKSGTLSFADGVATMTVTILVNGDLIDEYDQGFYVNLSGASGAVITDGQGFGTILDDDEAPTITIANVSAREGNKFSKSFNFIVTLSEPSEKQVYVYFATADGTATTADNDYVAKSGSFYFTPGVTSRIVSVQVIGDMKKELDETFFVNLSGATDATILDGQGIGEILNDEKR